VQEVKTSWFTCASARAQVVKELIRARSVRQRLRTGDRQQVFEAGVSG